MPDSPPMTAAEQDQFAAFMRARLPKQPDEEWHPVHLFTHFSARVLGLPGLLHWRGLTRAQASTVMQAAKREYPRQS